MQDQAGEEPKGGLLPVIHMPRGAFRIDQNAGDHLRIPDLMHP